VTQGPTWLLSDNLRMARMEALQLQVSLKEAKETDQPETQSTTSVEDTDVSAYHNPITTPHIFYSL